MSTYYLSRLSKLYYLLIGVFVLFAVISSELYAHPNDLIVKSVTRISHPDYFIKNYWFGGQDWALFNQDNTRLILHENSLTNPDTGTKGRGHVWGTIDNFKNWKDINEYNSKIKPIDTGMDGGPTLTYSILWSKIPGEEGIIYTTRTDGWLWRYDTDTDTAEKWIKCGCAFGWAITCWTSNNTIMLVEKEAQNHGWYELDVIAKTKTSHPDDAIAVYPPDKYYKNSPLFQELDFEYRFHGHSAVSPGKNLFVNRCGTSNEGQMCVSSLNSDGTMDLLRDDSPDGKGTHFSWNFCNDWFISSPGLGTWEDVPHLETRTIYQTHIDSGTGNVVHTPLITHTSPGKWKNGDITEFNVSAVPGATLSRNGKMMIFTGTDGLYSLQDYNAKGVKPWGMNGAFLVEFADPQGSIQNSNNVPQGEIDTPTENIIINVGDAVDFTGRGTDPDGDYPLSFHWNFGSDSGIPDSTEKDPGQKRFYNPGTFKVCCTVIDSNGSSDPTPDTRMITVESINNNAPVLDQLDAITVNEGDTIIFKPTANDPDGDNLIYTYSGWMSSDTYTTNYTDIGTHIVTVTVSDGLLSDSQNVTVTVKKIDTGNMYYWLEAESAVSFTSPMRVRNDGSASGGQYIEVSNGQGNNWKGTGGEAVYTVNITQAGEYILWGRVIAPNSSDDSFFVEVGLSANEAWGVENGNSWKWDMVNLKSGGADPVKYYLATGINKIKIGQREDGTKLDKLLLTNDMNYIPVGAVDNSVVENKSPVAKDDTSTVSEGLSVNINCVSNDTDEDGTIDAGTVAIINNPSNGISAQNGDGTVTYIPDSGFTGTDTFTYKVQDDRGAVSNEATVTVKITSVSVSNRYYWLEAEDAESISSPMQISNDYNASGGQYLEVPNHHGNNWNGAGAEAVYTVNVTKEGKYILWGRVIAPSTSDDSFFVEVGLSTNEAWDVEIGNNWQWDMVNIKGGLADPVEYYLTTGENKIKIGQREDGTKLDKLLLTNDINYIPDGNGGGENMPPIAADDTITVSEGLSVNINCVSNDTDVDGTIDVSTVSVINNPSNGIAVQNGDGRVMYKPDTGFTGTDTFTYTVQDDIGAVSNEATVTVTITGVNNLYGYYWLEAEDAESISSPMQVSNDDNASGGQYIEVPNGKGNNWKGTGAEAVYRVNITKEGEYVLWGRVIASSSSDDSFFVEVGLSANEAWGVENGNSWQWDTVSPKSGGSGPLKYYLTTGENKIKIGQREDGTKLDKLLLTNDMNYSPSQ